MLRKVVRKVAENLLHVKDDAVGLSLTAERSRWAGRDTPKPSINST
jgi:hypothetical protein